MSDIELRLECLRLAGMTNPTDANALVAAAQRLLDFAKGADNKPAPMKQAA